MRSGLTRATEKAISLSAIVAACASGGASGLLLGFEGVAGWVIVSLAFCLIIVAATAVGLVGHLGAALVSDAGAPFFVVGLISAAAFDRLGVIAIIPIAALSIVLLAVLNLIINNRYGSGTQNNSVRDRGAAA